MSKETIKKDVTAQKDRRGTTKHEHAETTIESPAAPDTPNGAEANEVKHVNRVVETVDEPGEGEHSLVETTIVKRRNFFAPENRRTVLIVAVVALVALVAMLFLWSRRGNDANTTAIAVTAKTAATDADGHAAGGEDHGAEEGAEVHLEPEALTSAGLEYEGVTQRSAIALLRVTGTIEANPRQTQQVSPLVGGRVERVNVAIGDRVGAGQVLAVISSPEIAEAHGKLREAETRLDTAQRTLTRVQRTENRVQILSAKARLDESETTLKRTRRLIELGAGAGKDLIAAEAAYKTAKAEHDFQSNIPLNRELQEAQAEVRTVQVDVSHQRQSLAALGAPVAAGTRDDYSQNISLITLRAPASGLVTERAVNAGAGVAAGTTLFTLSNLSSVYVIANVPEAQVGSVRTGTPAEIRSTALSDTVLRGQVNYVDPQLDEATRTARARIEIANPGERLRAGMFVEVGFQTTTGSATGEELVIPASAVQRVENKTIVFIPKTDEPGAFEAREIEVGGESDGYLRVLSKPGRYRFRVAANGETEAAVRSGEMRYIDDQGKSVVVRKRKRIRLYVTGKKEIHGP